MWNSLLQHVVSASSLSVFCSCLKSHFFSLLLTIYVLCLQSDTVILDTLIVRTYLLTYLDAPALRIYVLIILMLSVSLLDYQLITTTCCCRTNISFHRHSSLLDQVGTDSATVLLKPPGAIRIQANAKQRAVWTPRHEKSSRSSVLYAVGLLTAFRDTNHSLSMNCM